MIERLFQIDTEYGCFGITINDSAFVNKVPPIAKWMKGKHILHIKNWVKKNNYKIQYIPYDRT
jgi:hypothetical protein